MDLEKNLKTIKDCELDIELLERKNELLCTDNNLEIAKLKEKISKAEFIMEEELKKSGKDKLECKFDGYKGSTGWQKMPDIWMYKDEILMAWIISLPAIFKNLFIKVTTTIKKADLKRQIMIENAEVFKESKIIDSGAKLYLRGETKDYPVEGIEITHQDPKFKYTIKKLKK